MAISNFDDIISNRAGGKDDDRYWMKSTSRTPGAAGEWWSLFQSAGSPGAMTWNTTKTTGALMDSTNSGAIPIKASTSEDAYLLTGGVNVSSVSGFSALMYVDVVWGCKADTNSAWGNVSSFPALTRYTDGKGLMIIGFAETATSAVLSPTVTYVSPENSGQTVALTTTNPTVVAKCVPAGMTAVGGLMGSNTGVTSITSVAFNATAAGNFIVAIVKPLMIVPTLVAASYVERDSTSQIDGLIKLPRGSDNLFPCIGVLALGGGTSACATQSGFVRKVNATT